MEKTPYSSPLPHVMGTAPDLQITMPGGGQVTLPGLLWPARAAELAHDPLGAPPIAVNRVKIAEANALLAAWDHDLGAYRRPFGYEAFTLDVAGVPVAAAVSGTTVSTTILGHHRRDVVELARIVRHPDEQHEHVLRVLIRLWRLYLAPGWDDLPWRSRSDRQWTTKLAVTYQLPGKTGNLYKFDGWCNEGKCRPHGGGGWSKPSKTNTIGDGAKTLWSWRYGARP